VPPSGRCALVQDLEHRLVRFQDVCTHGVSRWSKQELWRGRGGRGGEGQETRDFSPSAMCGSQPCIWCGRCAMAANVEPLLPFADTEGWGERNTIVKGTS
jgi:hypothetical protein